MKLWIKILIVSVILVFCIGCDQATKWAAKRTLKGAAPLTYFHDTLRLHYTENPGAFLGWGGDYSETFRFWFFIVFAGLALGGVLVFTLSSGKLGKWELLLLSMFMGGGAGNLYDRIFQNGVVADFLNIGIGPVRTGIFNVADVFIMAGAAGLLFFAYIKRREFFGHYADIQN
ncbi:MAG: signal peptidase II [bacterium]|nr:signal peptidase II [bacterium]